MARPDRSGKSTPRKDARHAPRVFGFFLVVGLMGYGWSLAHAPANGEPPSGAARASMTGAAYAACQDYIRRSAPDSGRLTFPAEPESTAAVGDSLEMSSSLTVTPPLGTAYTQHFTCRAAPAGQAHPGAWSISRLAMDLPAS